MKKFSLSALVAAGLLAGVSTGASAADLGGNCCADLEERIAELEATTVRKGNRKVSLTISGWVAEQVVWFDDGRGERNVYVTGVGRTLQTNVKLGGEAQITSDISAGYLLHVEFGTVDAFTYSAKSDESLSLAGIANDTQQGIYTLQSYWYLKSKHYGQLSVGKMSQASDNAAILPDGSGSLVPANWLNIDGNGLSKVNLLGHCHTINDGIGADCNGVTTNVIKYDSPTIAGFSVSASWGEDDMWDVAGRYAGELQGFKVSAAIAYSQVTDENLALIPTAVNTLNRTQADKRVGYLQAGLYVQHIPTGLFAYAAYGKEDGHVNYNLTGRKSIDGEMWYVKAGLRQKFIPLGHSVFYGEYGQDNDMLSPTAAVNGGIINTTNYNLANSNLSKWGLGLVQEIDSAAMSIWLSYRKYDGHADIGGVRDTTLDTNVQYFKAGALINF